MIGSRFDTSHWSIVKNDPFNYQDMQGIDVCQESLCPNAHVLTILQVPELVYAIVMLFSLDLRPS